MAEGKVFDAVRVELIEIEGELALEFTSEMREYLTLEGDEVEVEFTDQGIEISKPKSAKPFDAAGEPPTENYGEAINKLAD